MSWIHTHNGKAVDIRKVTTEQIKAVGFSGIALGLAGVPRFNGHVGTYSNALHSWNVARWLRDVAKRPDLVIVGLFHDGEEWITGDMSTPMQHALADELRALVPVSEVGFDIGVEFQDARKRIARRLRAAQAVAFGFEMPVADAAVLPTPGERLDARDHALVKRADSVMLRTEKEALLGKIDDPEREASWLHGCAHEEPWSGARHLTRDMSVRSQAHYWLDLVVSSLGAR